jgi:hypothetical protein
MPFYIHTSWAFAFISDNLTRDACQSFAKTQKEEGKNEAVRIMLPSMYFCMEILATHVASMFRSTEEYMI